MKKFLFFLFFALPQLMYASINFEENLKQYHVSFDESVQKHFTTDQYQNFLNRKPQHQYMTYLKELYQKNNFLTKINSTLLLRIPRIIHQIWLGSPLPERYKKFQKTWQEFHPDWEYKLWTDDDVAAFNLVNKQAFDNAVNYAEKSNIFRYEILYRYGGLYIDTDFECLQPFDMLHYYYDFYAGIVSVNRLTLINNGLIGSIPGHDILKTCIEDIKNKVEYPGPNQFGRNGTIFFGYTVIKVCQTQQIDITKIFLAPPTYFYPWPGKDSPKKINEYILNSSFAIHYWDASWHRPIKDVFIRSFCF